MTSLKITEDSIPDLSGKTAVVTGGASGIGLGAVQVLLGHHAHVFILDVAQPPADVKATYIKTDISDWSSLVNAFALITTTHRSTIDIAIANAGVFEDPYFMTQISTPAPTDAAGWSKLAESGTPVYRPIEVNFKGSVNFVQLAARVMKGQKSGGSIVITASVTSYWTEQSIPIYSATKGALLNLIRALRPTLPLSNISINGVAPSACTTGMVGPEITGPFAAMGVKVSTPREVGLALIYSATATQSRRVEDYGKDNPVSEGWTEKWNGRVIHTLGSEYYEVEEKLIETRGAWWGEENVEAARKGRVLTDMRDIEGGGSQVFKKAFEQ